MIKLKNIRKKYQKRMFIIKMKKKLFKLSLIVNLLNIEDINDHFLVDDDYNYF